MSARGESRAFTRDKLDSSGISLQVESPLRRWRFPRIPKDRYSSFRRCSRKASDSGIGASLYGGGGGIAFSRAGPPIFVHKIFLASLVAIPRPPIKTSRVEAAAAFAKLGQTGRSRERERKRAVRLWWCSRRNAGTFVGII